MVQDINLEEVKQYNSTLKQYRDMAASLNAEIEYTNKELESLCAELTKELGKQVTKDNIEQIYNEQIQSIQSTLQSGKAVLNKIASEEQNNQSVASQNMQQAAPQPIQPVSMLNPFVQQAASQPAAPQPIPQAVNNPMMPPPVAGSVFSSQPQNQGIATGQNPLPTLFNI